MHVRNEEGRTMRIAIGGISHESSTLSTVPTSEVYLAVRGREWSNPWLATGVIAALGA